MNSGTTEPGVGFADAVNAPGDGGRAAWALNRRRLTSQGGDRPRPREAASHLTRDPAVPAAESRVSSGRSDPMW